MSGAYDSSRSEPVSDPYDVFFYEAFEEEADLLGQYLPTDLHAGFTWKTIQETGQVEPPAPMISTRTQSVLPPAWAPKLQAILSRSTGYDHLVHYRETTGISLPCGYLPRYCHRAVAEQAMLLWTALLRRLPRQIEQFRRFERDGLTGAECKGKTLIVVGVGNVGSEVVRIGQGLEMRVIGVDLEPKEDSVPYEPIEKALPHADVIACCMNLTPENVGYFSRERLLAAPRGVVFVNVARGQMAPSRVLLPLLREGHLGGVGLDVFDEESALAVQLRGEVQGQAIAEIDEADPDETGTDEAGPGEAVPDETRPDETRPDETGSGEVAAEVRATLELARTAGAILTPHNAFNSAEAVDRKAQQSIEQIEAFRGDGAFLWPVP